MDDQPSKSFKGNPGVHSALLAAVGGYLVYLGYQILKGELGGNASMPLALAIVIAVFFALAGLATIGYAAVIWKRSQKDAAKPSEEQPAQHENDAGGEPSDPTDGEKRP